MPELPEVETVVRTLEKQLQYAKIQQVHVRYPRSIEGDVQSFCQQCQAEVFCDFQRRGKYLLFVLTNKTMVVHLRMEGKFFIYPQKTVPNKHTHVIFVLEDGRELHYHDVRKFGRISLIEKQENYQKFHDLGVEPLTEEMTLSYLYQYAKKVEKPMKELLLDQHFIAGIGNIYADESLFKARIHPLSLACYLSENDWKDLRKAIIEVLDKAVKAGGSTIRSYTSSLGVTGLFQHQLDAYGRKGESCFRCGSSIQKIIVGGRGTHFCPCCQKKKKRIAITGGIASGKSSILQYFASKNYPVFSCDAKNAELLTKESVLLRIQEVFPQAFSEGKLSKKELAKIIFSHPSKRKELEKIMHPLIWESFLEETADYPICFVEVPLLFETKWEKYFDEIILVHSTKTLQQKRLRQKGMSIQEAKKRIEAQLSWKEKEKKADVCFLNQQGIIELYQQVEEWWKKHDWE